MQKFLERLIKKSLEYRKFVKYGIRPLKPALRASIIIFPPEISSSTLKPTHFCLNFS